MSNKTSVFKKYVLSSSIIMLSIGLTLVVAGALFAYYYFATYNPARLDGDLERTVSMLITETLGIVVKLAFLATGIWAGSILIKHGFTSLFERRKGKKKE